MISETMCGLGKHSSVIRAIFEYGRNKGGGNRGGKRL